MDLASATAGDGETAVDAGLNLREGVNVSTLGGKPVRDEKAAVSSAVALDGANRDGTRPSVSSADTKAGVSEKVSDATPALHPDSTPSSTSTQHSSSLSSSPVTATSAAVAAALRSLLHCLAAERAGGNVGAAAAPAATSSATTEAAAAAAWLRYRVAGRLLRECVEFNDDPAARYLQYVATRLEGEVASAMVLMGAPTIGREGSAPNTGGKDAAAAATGGDAQPGAHPTARSRVAEGGQAWGRRLPYTVEVWVPPR